MASKATTSTTASAIANKQGSHYYVAVSFTVAPQFGGTPTGTVTVSINDGSGKMCSGSVASGGCTIQNLTRAGNWTITASYPGDTNFTASSGTTSIVIP
jgi:hypothetical protein